MPLSWSFYVSFAGGFLIAIQSLFTDETESLFPQVVAGVALASLVGICVWYLIGDLKRFSGGWLKIGRSAYVLALSGISFLVGFYLAFIIIILCVILFVIWLMFEMIFGDISKKKTKKQEEDYYHKKVGGQMYERTVGHSGEVEWVDEHGNRWTDDKGQPDRRLHWNE